MDPADDRDELTARFLSEVAADPDSAFFPEDDLVDIFDYASDTDDAFVRMEVLIHGARLYPRSEALRVRRAYFYYFDGLPLERIETVLAPVDPANVLGALLRTRMACALRPGENADDEQAAPRAATATRELAALIDRTADFEDEEVIQLVGTAAECGVLDWLMRSLGSLEQKCSFLPTLYYELGETLCERKDYPAAAAIMEKLTEQEPFNADYWIRLAEVCGAMDDLERASQAADFALAIAPQDMRTPVLKARVLFEQRRSPMEIVKLLEPVAISAMERYGNTLPVEILASTYSWLLNDNDKASALLREALLKRPDSRPLLVAAAHVGSPFLAETAAIFFAAQEEELTPERLQSFLAEMSDAEHPLPTESIIALITAYYEGREPGPGIELLAQCLYLARDYEGVLELTARVNSAAAAPDASETVRKLAADPRLVLARVMSLLRLSPGSHAPAIEAIDAFLHVAPNPVSFMDNMTASGMVLRLKLIRNYLEKHPSLSDVELRMLDPFPPLSSPEEEGDAPCGSGNDTLTPP